MTVEMKSYVGQFQVERRSGHGRSWSQARGLELELTQKAGRILRRRVRLQFCGGDRVGSLSRHWARSTSPSDASFDLVSGTFRRSPSVTRALLPLGLSAVPSE